MKFEILLSCMNQDNLDIVTKSNIKTDCLVINQCNDEKLIEKIVKEHKVRMICTKERGLSKSRNMALRNSNADICLISDDDECFVDDVENIIIEAFRNSDADIIAFELKGYEKRLSTKMIRLKKYQLLKISSWQIALRKESLTRNNLCFDEKIGAGTWSGASEENKLLWDAFDAGLKIYFSPIIIGELKPSSSTWFRGYTQDYFEKRGATTRYYMGNFVSALYNIYFLTTKYKLYKKECSFFKAVIAVIRGYISSKEKIRSML